MKHTTSGQLVSLELQLYGVHSHPRVWARILGGVLGCTETQEGHCQRKTAEERAHKDTPLGSNPHFITGTVDKK